MLTIQRQKKDLDVLVNKMANNNKSKNIEQDERNRKRLN